ncbi:hypothetical protein [Metabacillus bambusae]|uniref:Uncharacterized protein n=1 Tax=Metabacillus bambusae TaxID=2795218 RepID=A0ABS3NBZ3_9BACI|nr:hypothetical protein [Metabacillus bambusae]MBO1515499.1 hypothetical protein [Metabacillus bambusae]
MTLNVVTHSGQDLTIEVETYDPILLNEQLNSNDIHTVLIGNTIFSKIDIKLVVPVTVEQQ